MTYEQAEKQAPVLWQWKDSEMVTPFDNTNVEGWTPLYTTPQPQREWVGLTDEEIVQIALDTPIEGTNFAKAIQAELKRRNT